MLIASTVLGLAAAAAGQGTGYAHQWVGGTGYTESDFTRGVAVWHNGTTISASEAVATPGGGLPTARRGEVAFVDRDGAILWTALIQPLNTQSAAAATAVACGVPDAEGNTNGPVVYATGWYQGWVYSPLQGDLPFASERRTVVSKLSRSTFNSNPWNVTFAGEGPNEGLCAAAGGPCCTGTSSGAGGGTTSAFSGGGSFAAPAAATNPPGPPACLGCVVAIGGFYTGATSFGSIQRAGINGQDAYVAFLGTEGGSVLDVLAFGGTGDDRVTGVAFDLHNNDLVVTGSFTSGDINFNPNGSAAGPTAGTFPGGTNIFVARYRFVHVSSGAIKPMLYWRWTFGTSGDDACAAVAVDSAGDVYVTGHKADAQGGGDLWIAKFLGLSPWYLNTSVIWQHDWPGPGDDRGRGVCVDGIDRVVVTGQFGKPRAGEEVPVYCLDFDPSPGAIDTRCTGGGLDVFVSRFRPDGSYDWTFTIGGNYNDVGSCVAIDPAATGRLANGGWFGDPDAPPSYQYTVDFDPGPGAAVLSGLGRADGFTNTFRPAVSEDVSIQVSLVIDNSESVSGPTSDNDYGVLMSALRTRLQTTGVVPQNGTVAMNVVYYGMDAYPGGAVPVMPWTVMTPETAPLFAERLARQRRLMVGGNRMADGIKVATDALIDAGYGPGVYASALVIADERDDGTGSTSLPAAREYALDVGRFDRISAYAVYEDPGIADITRGWCVDTLIGSRVGTGPVVSGDASIGFAGEPSTTGSTLGFQHPDFAAVLERMLMRTTVCPSDYDRNGFYEQAVDPLLFGQASMLNLPYADWNFDGVWDGHLGGSDWTKFDAGAAVACP